MQVSREALGEGPGQGGKRECPSRNAMNASTLGQLGPLHDNRRARC